MPCPHGKPGGSGTTLLNKFARDYDTEDAVTKEEQAGPVEPPRRRSHVYGVIACQGDSLTFGSRDPDGMSYPLYLGRLLSQKHGQTWVSTNFGVPGECWAEIW